MNLVTIYVLNIYIYIYIYIYMCVCVCVCLYICAYMRWTNELTPTHIMFI